MPRTLEDALREHSVVAEKLQATLAALKSLYLPRFPELASFPLCAHELARVVQSAANLGAPGNAHLPGLPPQTIADSAVAHAVILAANNTAGRPLDEPALARALQLADDLLALVAQSEAAVAAIAAEFASSHFPNLAQIASPGIAAQLVTAAGSLFALSATGKNIQFLDSASGADRATRTRVSGEANPHFGLIWRCPRVQQAPAGIRLQVARVVSSKSALAARRDSVIAAFAEAELMNGADAGLSAVPQEALDLAAEVDAAIERLLAPKEALASKVIKPPQAASSSKSHRAGRKFKARRERRHLSEAAAEASKVAFGAGCGDPSVVRGIDAASYGLTSAEAPTILAASAIASAGKSRPLSESAAHKAFAAQKLIKGVSKNAKKQRAARERLAAVEAIQHQRALKVISQSGTGSRADS
jgi:RNA processing factor Prp31